MRPLFPPNSHPSSKLTPLNIQAITTLYYCWQYAFSLKYTSHYISIQNAYFHNKNAKGQLLSNAYKYSVVDLGLRNILQTNNPAADLGHKLENVVYFELLHRGGEVYAGRADNGEVDFVVMKANGKREYYQVAHTANEEKTLKRELSSLERIRDSSP